MKFIDEIIELLSSDSSNLTDALFKTKVLAFRLGEKEISEWVTKELEGYSTNSEIPPYRIESKTVYGFVSNGYKHYPQLALSTHHLPADLQDSFNSARFGQSISALEDFARENKELKTPIPPEFNQYLSESFDGDFFVEQAWAVVSVGAPKQIVTRVRARLLDFLLELSGKFPDDVSENEMKKEAKKNEIGELFHKTVFGDNTTIVLGDRNTLTFENNVKKGDFDSLARELSEHKVAYSEIEELKAAIEADSENVDYPNKEFGQKVKSWINKISSKTANTSLAVAAGAGGNILAKAISTYYGF